MQKFTLAQHEFIQRLRLAPDFCSSWNILHDALGRFGVQSITYAFVPHANAKDPKPIVPLLASSHCPDFMAYYDKSGHLEHDTNVRHCVNGTQPLIWYNQDLMGRLTPRQRQVERDAYDFGQRSGVTIPLRGDTPFDRGGAGLNAGDMSDKAFRDMLRGHLPEVLTYAELFNEAVISRFLLRDRIRLSPRETDCLHWVAEGYTAEQVADALHIGTDTVKQYLDRARQKLNALTVTQAVARATALGMLDETPFEESSSPAPPWGREHM